MAEPQSITPHLKARYSEINDAISALSDAPAPGDTRYSDAKSAATKSEVQKIDSAYEALQNKMKAAYSFMYDAESNGDDNPKGERKHVDNISKAFRNWIETIRSTCESNNIEFDVSAATPASWVDAKATTSSGKNNAIFIA